MAFFSKVGNILRQTANKHIHADLSASRPSIYQAIRCMSSSKLFVGGISYSTDEQSLSEAFSKYGQVLEARVIVDRETGRSRGFGFVTYSSSEEASSAIQALDGQDLHGRRVRVNYANDRARGGGGFGGGYGSGGGGYGGNYGTGGGYSAPGGNYGGNAPYGGSDNYGSGGNYGSGYSGDSFGTGVGGYDGGNQAAGNTYGSGANYAGGNTYGSDNYASSGTGGGNDGGAGLAYGSGNQFGGSNQFGGDQFGGSNQFGGDQFGGTESSNMDDANGDFNQDESVDGNWRDGDDTDVAKRA